MQPVESNIRRMANYGQVLAVECAGCHRRRTFTAEDLVAYSDVGDMDAVARIARSMRCAGCGARDAVAGLIRAAEAEAWLRG